MNASGTLDPPAARAAGLAIDAELALRRHEDRDAARARGQRAAARVRGRGRDAQLDRPAEPRPRGLRRDDAARRARARPPARRLGRRLRARRLRARLPAPRRRAGHRRARAQRLLPERQERLHLDRQRRGRDRGRRAALPRGDAAAALGQALAERRRHRGDRASRPSGAAPTRSCSPTRCAGSRSTTRTLDAAARRGHGRALGPGAQARRPGGGARVPCGLRAADRRGGRHRERVGRARVPGRRARAPCRSGAPRSASRCSPGASATNSPPYSQIAG